MCGGAVRQITVTPTQPFELIKQAALLPNAGTRWEERSIRIELAPIAEGSTFTFHNWRGDSVVKGRVQQTNRRTNT